MKKLLSLGVLSLFLVMPTLSSSAPSGSQDHDLASSPELLRVLVAARNVGLIVYRAVLQISKQRARQSRPTYHWSFMPDS